MLEVRNLFVNYGGIQALRGIDIDVGEQEIVTIIGSNGAGKSTLLNAVSGFLKLGGGTIRYDGRDLGTQATDIVKLGICHVPEGRLVFANMSVMDNLAMGAYLRTDKAGVRQDLDRVMALFPILKARAQQVAGTLSGGEQQMLAIGRGLMSNPKVMMLDEPSLGLAPLVVKTVFRIIQEIRAMGKTILLVEQNATKALSIADRAYVLEQGRITLAGQASMIAADETVREAYLGKKAAIA
jgi:branched-chain amino acid transport system ATP-binding protein